MSKSLIVGNTAQLARYFPENFMRIPARDFEQHLSKKDIYDSVYLVFGENRTYLEDKIPELFDEINYRYTLSMVDYFLPRASKIVLYGTAKIWNCSSGPITINTSPHHLVSPYIESKKRLVEKISETSKYNSISCILPFNFNGKYRSGEFLFGKICKSIKTQTTCTIRDTYFFRDITLPIVVSELSMQIQPGQIMIAGSGKVTFINSLIRNMYLKAGLDYKKLCVEDLSRKSHYRDHVFFAKEGNGPCGFELTNAIIEEFTN